jgi:hypothetical protein
MNVEDEIRDLKARLQAIETVHALLIGTMARVAVDLTGSTPDKLMASVRGAISTSWTGSDPILRERMQLLSEQFVDDAVHLIIHCMKAFDQPSTDQ